MTELENLKAAVKALLDKRSITDLVHEEAYDFVFKSWGMDEWNALVALTGWVAPELEED